MVRATSAGRVDGAVGQRTPLQGQTPGGNSTVYDFENVPSAQSSLDNRDDLRNGAPAPRRRARRSHRARGSADHPSLTPDSTSSQSGSGEYIRGRDGTRTRIA